MYILGFHVQDVVEIHSILIFQFHIKGKMDFFRRYSKLP